MLPVLWLAASLAVAAATSDEICSPPDEIENGKVIAYAQEQTSWVGQYKCNAGFILVGASKAKCRNGVWSSSPPVCTAVGKCDRRSLPRVKHSRLVERKGFRGAVWRYKCKKGYTRYGEGSVYCDGDSWNIFTPPICARPGCDMSAVSELRYGQVKSEDNSIVKFSCDSGATRVGSALVWCDGQEWNDTIPQCHKEASSPTLSLSMSDLEFDLTSGEEPAVCAGQQVTVLCKGTGGFPEPLISIHLDGVEMNPSQEFMNSYTFTAEKHHFGSTIECHAKNYINVESATSHANLMVKYTPEAVTLYSPPSGQAGQLATVQCVSEPGYLEPHIFFKFSESMEIMDEIIEHQKTNSGAFISTIERSFVLPENVDSVDVTCMSEDMSTHNTSTIDIQSPCLPPVFDTELDTITAKDGEVISIVCKSAGGNPKPTVNILMNGEILGSGMSEATAELMASPDLHETMIECSAANEIMVAPFFASKTLDILYGPSEVYIETVDEVNYDDVPDIEATCHAGISNPPATISWTISQDGVNKDLTEEEERPEGIRFTTDEGVQEVTVKCTAENDVSVVETEQIIKILYPAVTTAPEVITVEPEVATESMADTEAIDAEYPTEEHDIEEITTSEDGLLSADAVEIQDIQEYTSENPIFNVELADAEDFTTEENKANEEESEFNEENEANEEESEFTSTDRIDSDKNNIENLFKLSISSLEDLSEEPSVTYKIINGKHSESESENKENNDDKPEKRKHYNDGKNNEEYTLIEMTSEEIDYYSPKKGKAYSKYDERMSSDEAHRYESTEENVDLFTQEKDEANDMMNPKFKMSTKSDGGQQNDQPISEESNVDDDSSNEQHMPPKSLKQQFSQTSAAISSNQSILFILCSNLMLRAFL